MYECVFCRHETVKDKYGRRCKWCKAVFGEDGEYIGHNLFKAEEIPTLMKNRIKDIIIKKEIKYEK